MPSLRLVLLFLAALFVFGAGVPAPAGAHHRDGGGWEDPYDDGSVDDGSGGDEGSGGDGDWDDGFGEEPGADGDWPLEGDRPEPQPRAPVRPRFPVEPPVTKPTIGGKVAKLRTNGRAAIPRGAPRRVRAVLAAANKIIGKPYKWGGGHARLVDRGYDCSGAVSYALIRSGHLRSPMVSGSFARWGRKGRGRWITIYANRGHVYMEVAGLRLDTSSVGDRRGRKGVRWRPVIGKRRGFAVRHIR